MFQSFDRITCDSDELTDRTGTGFRCLSGRPRLDLLVTGLQAISFDHVTRVLQDSSRDISDGFLLSSHAIFPSVFRLQVGPVTLGYFPES